MIKHKSAAHEWATKVLLLVRAGQVAPAVSQIKASASLKDVQQLRKLFDAAQPPLRSPDVDVSINDQLHELSHPRLHRSP